MNYLLLEGGNIAKACSRLYAFIKDRNPRDLLQYWLHKFGLASMRNK